MLVTFLQILKPIKVLSNDESSFDHKDATRVDQLHQARDQKDHVASISISPQTSCFHFLLYVVSLSFCCFSVSFSFFLFLVFFFWGSNCWEIGYLQPMGPGITPLIGEEDQIWSLAFALACFFNRCHFFNQQALACFVFQSSASLIKDLCLAKYNHFGIPLPSWFHLAEPDEMPLYNQEQEVSWISLINFCCSASFDQLFIVRIVNHLNQIQLAPPRLINTSVSWGGN